MALNCKPGDLAFVVSAQVGYEWSIGRVVHVLSFMGSTVSRRTGRLVLDVWLIDAIDGPGGLYDQIEDSNLRPIRGSGDDAQDESKSWLPPVPTKEHA